MLISTHAMSAFIGEMALREGIKDFGWQVASFKQIPLLVRMIQSSTTLLHALKTICRLGYHESSNIQIWLEEREETLFFCYRGSLEPGALGADELAMMRTRVVTRIVQKFAGPDWTPPECGFELADEISQLVREDFGNARLRCVPNYGWVQLPKSILVLS
jgi:hypothetical protein